MYSSVTVINSVYLKVAWRVNLKQSHHKEEKCFCRFVWWLTITVLIVVIMWWWWCSVTQSRPTVCYPHGLQHARRPWPSLSPRVCSNSCPLSRWCHPTISSSVIPFFSFLHSLPASVSFPMSRFFASGGQSIDASASASALQMHIWGWFPLELTGLKSLLCKELPRDFSSTTIQKHQVFGTQPSI